jgi:hypothetical protein
MSEEYTVETFSGTAHTVLIDDPLCMECLHDLAHHVLVMELASLDDDGKEVSKIGRLDCSECECKMEI